MNRKDYTYTPLFCEENIWKLIESLYTNKLAKPIDVLFLLNENNHVALFNQKLSNDTHSVIWDYHVILTAENNTNIIVYDFDSRCEFPTAITDYFSLTFPAEIKTEKSYRTLIKAISAEKYFKLFYSDRHHMIGIIDDKDFPDYEIINPKNTEKSLTLDCCRDLSEGSFKLMSPLEYLAINRII